MDQVFHDALASPEGMAFQAAYDAEVGVQSGFASAAPGAFDWTTAIGIVNALAPIITAAIAGGFSPALLVTLLPSIIKVFAPGISDSLVSLLESFLTAVIGKLPTPTV